MSWTEILIDDTRGLQACRDLLIQMGSWYDRLATIVKLQRSLNEGAHIYRYLDDNHEVVIAFHNKGIRGWKAAHFGYLGAHSLQAIVIVARKVISFLNEQRVQQCYALVPLGEYEDDGVLTFYDNFKRYAWIIETSPIPDGERWIINLSGVRPLVNQ